MRRAALLDMLKVIFERFTRTIVECDRDGEPCEVEVPRCAGLHFAEPQSFKARSTQFSTVLHTSEWRDGPALEMPVSTAERV
jgi:hypothetical protein